MHRTSCKSPSLYTEISSTTQMSVFNLSWIYIYIHHSCALLATLHIQAPPIHLCMWPTKPPSLFVNLTHTCPSVQHLKTHQHSTEPESIYIWAWVLFMHAGMVVQRSHKHSPRYVLPCIFSEQDLCAWGSLHMHISDTGTVIINLSEYHTYTGLWFQASCPRPAVHTHSWAGYCMHLWHPVFSWEFLTLYDFLTADAVCPLLPWISQVCLFLRALTTSIQGL